MVADQSKAKWNAALRRITDSSGDPGVGHRHDQVRIHRSFARQLAPKFLAAGLNRASEYAAVGTREIHVLKNAARLRCGGRIETRVDPFVADDDQLSRLHVPHILSSDEIESAGF